MSYILDALKKSERERALGNIRALDSAVMDYGRRVPLAWVIAVLSLVVAVFVVYESRSLWLPASELASPSGKDAAARTGVGIGAVGNATPAATAPAGTQNETSPAQGPQVVSREEPAAATSDPVPLSELDPSVRNQVPQMSINALSYSLSEKKRFVMINQNIYKQGDNMGNGVVVEDIRRTDVVLSFRGVRFTLAP